MITILVDFDNVPRSTGGASVESVVRRIADRVLSRETSSQRVHYRLYGGWYELRSMTRRAQALSTEIHSKFPLAFTPINTPTVTHRLNAELAYSLLIDPTHHLLHTFRKRGLPSGLKASPPKDHGCIKATCGISALADFVTQGACSEPGCQVTCAAVVGRDEQKLVDVMLATDLIHLASCNPSDQIIVVTGDHDLWPAIRQAIASGAKLTLLNTRPKPMPAFYSRLVASKYTEILL